MILYGDRGESGKIYLTPSDGTTFEPGKQYRVSVNIKDIGKVLLILQSFDPFAILRFRDLQWLVWYNKHEVCDRPHFYTEKWVENKTRSRV